jgi:hypothetical protein
MRVAFWARHNTRTASSTCSTKAETSVVDPVQRGDGVAGALVQDRRHSHLGRHENRREFQQPRPRISVRRAPRIAQQGSGNATRGEGVDRPHHGVVNPLSRLLHELEPFSTVDLAGGMCVQHRCDAVDELCDTDAAQLDQREWAVIWGDPTRMPRRETLPSPLPRVRTQR